MQAFKRPVIPLVLSYMIGIGMGAYLGDSYLPALITCALSTAAIIRQRWHARSMLLAPIFLVAALGYLSILPWVAPRFPHYHIVHHLEAEPLTLIGQVSSRPSRQSGRTRFIFNSKWQRSADAVTKSAGKVRVTISGDMPLIERGQTLELSGRLHALNNFRNPGGFDYKRRMAYEQIWASLYTPAKRVRIVAAPARGALPVALDRVRSAAGRLIDLNAGGDQAAVLRALLIGDQSQISSALRQTFSRAGVGHILAISGLHIGIVAATAFAVFGWCLRQFRWVLLRGWNRKLAAGLTLIPVIAYGLIAGMSPSTQRAVLMAVVVLAAFWVERDLDTFSSLAMAAWIILIVHPPSLFAISFQLSFAAVFAIVFGLDRIKIPSRIPSDANGVRKIMFRLRSLLVAMATVSLLAIWGTLPLTMTYFNQMSLAGVLANLLVVPAVGFCVVPLGLTALCIWPLRPDAAGAIIALNAWLLSVITPVIALFARLPLSLLNTWRPTALETACFYLMGVAGLAVLTQPACGPRKCVADGAGKTLQKAWSAGRNLWLRDAVARRIKNVGSTSMLRWVLIFTLLVTAGDSVYWLHQRYWHRDLRITILDVGHGNASLVEFPGGDTLLIDGGGFADITAFDLGARVLAPYLRHQKIMTVDTVVLSHPNSDHLNGLIHICENFNVKQLWTNGEAHPTLGYRLLMENAAANRISSPDFRNLVRQHTSGGVRIRILYPPSDFLSKRANESWRDTNNNSLVVQLIYGDHSFLFPGDITRKAEAELVARSGPAVRSTVLVVPHHGSKSSSSQAFVSAVKPDIAIVSARDRGKRRHPHPTVADRYRRHRCRLFFTEKHGAIRLVSDGENLRVEPFVKE